VAVVVRRSHGAEHAECACEWMYVGVRVQDTTVHGNCKRGHVRQRCITTDSRCAKSIEALYAQLVRVAGSLPQPTLV
jgi:hypothetical protein